jgi:hypothetical protein
MKFGVAERFRLEIYWSKAIYKKEGETSLVGCYLIGPVIKEIDQMEQEDSIALDFGNQYRIFVPQYYVARLSWKGVVHTPTKIYLDNVVLSNKFTNSIPNLNDDDFMVVNTKDHTDTKHEYHLMYLAYLINNEGELYNFRG